MSDRKETRSLSPLHPNRKDVCIVGNGRFGAYLADRIKCQSPVDDNLHVSTIDVATPAVDRIDLIHAANIVIFAVPIRHLNTMAIELSELVQPGTLVMDVCSIKEHACDILAMLFQGIPRVDLVGTHPMFGPQTAPTITNANKVAICPIRGSTDRAVRFWESLGASTVILSAAEHDQQACQQMFDHFVCRAALAAGVRRVELSTRTHEMFMDIADIVDRNSIELFQDMCRYNRHAKPFLSGFIKTIHSMFDIVFESVSAATSTSV